MCPRTGKHAALGKESIVGVRHTEGRRETCMRAGKPVLRGLRKAVSRLLIVDAFEDKIVAEHEPIARGVRRARNRPSTGVTVTSTATSVVAVTFTSISILGSPL